MNSLIGKSEFSQQFSLFHISLLLLLLLPYFFFFIYLPTYLFQSLSSILIGIWQPCNLFFFFAIYISRQCMCIYKVVNIYLNVLYQRSDQCKVQQPIKCVYIVSNGCASQFRSRYVFSLLTHNRNRFISSSITIKVITAKGS